MFQGLTTHDGVVPADGTWGGGQRVRSTEQSCDGQLLVMDTGRGSLHVLRPVLTASRPSQTMAQMGPLNMSVEEVSRCAPAYVTHIGNLGQLRTGDEALVERLVREILVVRLEVLF